MIGWRGRIGFISPSTVQLPWELTAMLPEGVGVIATVLSVRSYQDAEFERALQGVEPAIDVVVGEGAQAVYVAGVPLAVRQGYRKEQEAHRVWTERKGIPVTSSLGAVVAGLERLGARRPVVVTAYPPELNDAVARYLVEAGLEPLLVKGLSLRSPAEASRVEATTYYQLARELVARHADADAVLLLARTDLQQVALLLEQDLGLPAVHQTQAALWWALERLRVSDRRNGGRLLRLVGETGG
jgi:maleate cis-trans isomerase